MQIAETEQIENEEFPLRDLLFKTLEINGAMTRAQIVQAIEKPRTTIYDNLDALINQKKVKKFSRQVNARGRPVVFFKLKKE
jgi:predicted ArsR family transcriptional regulator